MASFTISFGTHATTRSIDIGQFVQLDSVDPVYFGGTYILAPAKGGIEGYAPLA